MAAGVIDRLWNVEDLVAAWGASEGIKPGMTRKETVRINSVCFRSCVHESVAVPSLRSARVLMLSHAEIIEILNRDVYSASERLTKARQKVDSIISEVPGELPQPDGQHRIMNASKEHTKAMRVLEVALKRHSGFTLNGIIPEELKANSGNKAG
jgi:hypothetical protein